MNMRLVEHAGNAVDSLGGERGRMHLAPALLEKPLPTEPRSFPSRLSIFMEPKAYSGAVLSSNPTAITVISSPYLVRT